ncbi:MAG: iron-containing alcohol dehydrogenase [Clostridiales bacterium]|nr:iron-containing alcohol dehydrogenase [Clostridiales bacterium]
MPCDYSVKAPVLYGVGAIHQLGEKVKLFGAKKPMLICDPNLAPETYEKAIASVKAAGLDYVMYAKTRRDAPIEVIDECGEIALREKADCLVGIGGGSTIDTAKATSILLSHPGPIKQYILAQPIAMDVNVPIILVPTTAGTGSECTKVAVVNRTDLNMKWSVFVSISLAIIDPELTLSLPPYETAYTGMDALSHAIEGLTSNNPHPLSHAAGLDAIRKIIRNLPKAYRDGSDLAARIQMSEAAHLAGICFDDPLTHIGHATADGMSINFHTPHGIGCALATPEVCALCGPAVPEIMREIAEAMELPLTGSETGKELGEMCAAKCRELMHEINIPTLKELGHTREEMAAVANETETSHLSTFCPLKVTKEIAEKFVLDVYDNYQ